jgi:capsule polysaccharide export protein KpsE/RkpR
LAKIEAYNNGNGTTPAALTLADYAAAGITGVNADNLAAVNAQVLKQGLGGANTVGEVQALVTAANTALAKIEAYNNGNGTTPLALTEADYAAAGITGVTADNLAAVNAQVLAQAALGADTAPEVQALVTAANAALAKIEAYNNGNGTTPAALTLADYAAAGITGVNADNLAAVNAQVLKQGLGGANTVGEVQALVTAANTALAKIEAYNNGNGTTPLALTEADYAAAGITGVTADNLAAVNAQVLAQAALGADTAPEVQALVTAANAALAKIEAYNNGNGTTPAALTLADYAAAGITGVNADNLAAVNAQVLKQGLGGANTVGEVQALVTAANTALAKIEAYNNGNGTTPLALTEADYAAAGITGVTADNLAAVNAQVLAQAALGADTAPEVQALVTAANAALAKIEAYNNGDGTTPAALTLADYAAAGITGVTADNLAAVNAQVLAQAALGADTAPEVQALVTAANAALAKIEAYNNGNGTTPAALTLADYAAAGITGVNADNLAAVNAQVLKQGLGGANTVGEVQALVTAANTALAKIEAYNNGNGTTPLALTEADYAAAGITGVTADNLAAVNAQVLAQAALGADTAPEVQALVTAANAALAKIEAYNNGNGTTPAALTLADYAAAGITGVNADNLAAVNAQVLKQGLGGANTVGEVQALVTAANTALAKIEAYNNGNGTTPLALTEADYAAAGITGVTADNLAAVNAQVLAQAALGADTAPEVQALVTAANAALAKIEAYNNGNGTTPAALTLADYAAAGITGVNADNLAAVNAQVLKQGLGGANTVGEVQALVTAANTALAKIEAYNNGNGTTPLALTEADYAAAGITGVTADNLAAVNAQVLAQAALGADTAPEVQALVTAANTALAKIEAYNNGDGTTPAALTVADYAAAGITGSKAALNSGQKRV